MTEKTNAEIPLYFGALESSFTNGLRIDIRARLAIEFLKAGLLARPGDILGVLEGKSESQIAAVQANPAKYLAIFALDLATEFLDQSVARGLTKDLPETAELTAHDRLAIERQVRTQLYGQHVGNRIMREEADRVATPPPGLVRT